MSQKKTPRDIARRAFVSSHILSVRCSNLISMMRNNTVDVSPLKTYPKRCRNFVDRCVAELDKLLSEETKRKQGNK